MNEDEAELVMLPSEIAAAEAVRDGELIRLRNRIAALEENGAELLRRTEKAEYDLEICTHTARSNARAQRYAYLESEKQRERAEAAEAAIKRVSKHADEIGAMALADWETDEVSQSVRVEMLRNARAIQRALSAPESPATASTAVSAATEAHGGAGEAQEGSQ